MKNALILVLIMLCLSCTQQNTSLEEAVLIEETPEALNENYSDVAMGSFNKRYHSSVIDKLFEEAMGNKPKLKSLVKELDEMEEMRGDSLKAFRKYIRNNNTYWQSVYHELGLLNDTIMSKEVEGVFKTLQASYESRLRNHLMADSIIWEKNKVLNDYRILMKLVVTEPMMHNYQNNELPDIKQLNDMAARLDSLILKAKPFTEIQK